MISLIVVAILAILVAFLLSAADTALTRMSRSRAEQLAEDGRKGASALVDIVADSAPYLSVATFVRVLAEATAAVAVTVAVDIQTDSHWQTALIAIAIMTVVSFVVVGVSPRTIGRQHGERVALLAAPIVRTLRVVLGPVAKLLILFGNALTPGRGFAEGPFASEAELRDLVDLAGESAVIEAEERQMIHSIFELGDTVVREVMVPRPDMVTIHKDKVLRQAMSMFLRSGFSRVPVVGEDADDVLGVLYFKDVVRQVNANPDAARTVPVTEVMRPVQRVPDSKPVDDLLREMQVERQHFAIVIDEYGGTAGLITMEDILEEIVGDIQDEFDENERPDIESSNNNEWSVSGKMLLSELNDIIPVEMHSDEVDTIAGWLYSQLNEDVAEGKSVRLQDYLFTITELENHRITRVSITYVGENAPPTESDETVLLPAQS